MSAPLAFIDCETTGLDPERHEVWEVAMIRRCEHQETEHVWQLPVRLGDADPMALNIGRFHERRLPEMDSGLTREQAEPLLLGDPTARWQVPAEWMFLWAREFVDLTRGHHLVGAVVSFDADRLWRLLRRLDECPMWHYHLVDVEALAVGWLAGSAKLLGAPTDAPSPPWDSEDVSRLLNVDPEAFEKHTALGDARWARAVYDAVMA